MDFVLLKVGGLVIWTAVVWLIGRHWPVVNSVSDLETTYKAVLAKAEATKALVSQQATDLEAKAAKLKALV